jgi:hypothetical protein
MIIREPASRETLFGLPSGRHTHPVTHPLWLEFTDSDCVVCDAQRAAAQPRRSMWARLSAPLRRLLA